jgi:DNA polymerase-1
MTISDSKALVQGTDLASWLLGETSQDNLGQPSSTTAAAPKAKVSPKPEKPVRSPANAPGPTSGPAPAAPTAQLDLSAALAVAAGADAGGQAPPKRKSKAKGAPKAPPVPNPFANLPAPALPPTEMVRTAERLAEVITAWLARNPEFVVLDLETTGLEVLAGARPRLMQLLASDEDTVLLVDLWATPGWEAPIAELLSQRQIEIVGHNITFDLEMLRAVDVITTAEVRCTQQAAQALSGGCLPHPKRASAKGNGLDLASCAGRTLGVFVSKELQQGGEHGWGHCPEPGVPFSGLADELLIYGATDVVLTKQLRQHYWKKLAEKGLLEVVRIEGNCLPAVIECRVAGGLLLDLPKAKAMLASGETSMEALEQQAIAGLGVENIRSTVQLADAVERRGHQLPLTEKGNRSVSEDALRPIEDSDLDPLKDYRALAKNVSTYLRNWVKFAEWDPEGRIRPQLKSWGASTGRMTCPKGGKEIPAATTLQGVPKDSAFRALFIAKPGHCLIGCDYGQIEQRLALAIYGEETYRRIFAEGLDGHAHVASILHGEPIDKKDPRRDACKVPGFAMQYGGTEMALINEQGMSEAAAKAFVKAWRAAHPTLAAKRDEMARTKPWEVRSISGRVMRAGFPTKGVPGERHSGFQQTRFKAPPAVNFPVQSSGAELLKEAITDLHRRIQAEMPDVQICHLCHDEVICEAPLHLAESAAALIESCMRSAYLEAKYLQGTCLLEAEAVIGASWKETKGK